MKMLSSTAKSILKRSTLGQVRCFLVRMMSSAETSSSSSDDVILTKVDSKGIITLNRPKSLNALNLSMINKIYPQLKKWHNDDNMSMVIIKGAGDKAFCAGGDVRAVAEDKGGPLSKDFFWHEYRLNNLIGTLAVPYIAIMDGITMGGGVGLSVHGLFRVATERTVFAMPETAIGFFPDVGGSYFLPRLPGKLGNYLALTGFRLTGRDVWRARIATHFVTSAQLKHMEQDLLNLKKPTQSDIDNVLSKHHEQAESEFHTEFALKHVKGKINNLFDAKTVEEVYFKLKLDGSEWANKQAAILNKMSPSSLKVTLRQLQYGSAIPLEDCLQMEYRLAQRFMKEHDFYEGVRAVLIDKSGQPKWSPATLEDVSEDLVESYFKPLPKNEELKLL